MNEKSQQPETCEVCRYFHQASGRCRRHPPVVVKSADDEPETVFPKVTERMWCGDFRKHVDKS